MKINSYLLFALVVILFSYTLADVSKQETTPQKAKEAADAKVEAKGDGGKYGVNYGGGGGNYGGGGGNYGGGGGNYGGGGGNYGGGGCHHGCCNRGYGGSCNRCCASPEEEAKAFAENQAEAKQSADTNKVEAKGDQGQYGVNYGGGGGGNYGGGGGNYGGGGGGGNYGGGGGCHHGCCNRGYRGSCNRCCASPEEAKAFSENQAEAKQAGDTQKVEAKADEGKYGVNYGGGGGGNYGGGGGGGGSGWGGGCHHGCCNRGYGGSCSRCCASPAEAKALGENKEAKSGEGNYGVNYGGGGGGGGGNYGGGGGNYGGGGGGGCHHGCCYRGHGGSCNRCCSSPEEAKAFAENQSRP